MKKLIIIASLCLLSMAGIKLVRSKIAKPSEKVGILVPMEHQALTDMVEGFKEALVGEYGGEIEIDVQNAQGDQIIQKAIINRFGSVDYRVVAAIGTATSQMMLKSIRNKPVVCLDVTEDFSKTIKNATGLLEAKVKPSFDFLLKFKPEIKSFTVIYSTLEKIHGQVAELKHLAQEKGIKVQAIMVQNISDLYTIGRQINAESEAILILKDHVVVSGVASLAKTAAKMKIPLIASDDGSVKGGAAFALGNSEKQIGFEGGKIAVKLLSGIKPEQIKMKPVANQSLFIKSSACKKQGVSLKALTLAAGSKNEIIRD